MESWDIRTLGVDPHLPQVLRSDGESRVIALNLPTGDELQEHRVHERTYLVVADGEVEISQRNGRVAGGPGFVAHFEPNEPRTVRARRDARLLMFLSPWPGEGHPSLRVRERTPAA